MRGPWKQGGGRRGADLVVGTARCCVLLCGAVHDARGAEPPMLCGRAAAGRKGGRDHNRARVIR
jgi:hypothetical protein